MKWPCVGDTTINSTSFVYILGEPLHRHARGNEIARIGSTGRRYGISAPRLYNLRQQLTAEAAASVTRSIEARVPAWAAGYGVVVGLVRTQVALLAVDVAILRGTQYTQLGNVWLVVG
jgi:hypothetical protein